MSSTSGVAAGGGGISVPYGVMRIEEERGPEAVAVDLHRELLRWGTTGVIPVRPGTASGQTPYRERRSVDRRGAGVCYGIRTWLMTWMTPLEALTSALVTWALLT
jgi:hypothetical protein